MLPDPPRAGKQQRIVGNRIELDAEHAFGLRDGVAHRAVHLRDATQRVAVLRLVFLAAAERLEALVEFFTAMPLVQGHPIPGDVESQRIETGFRPAVGQPGTELRHQMVGDIHQA